MELRHPRIAAVLDVVVGAAEIAIVSEHITGAILQSLVQTSNPASASACRSGLPPASRSICSKPSTPSEAPWAELFPSADPTEDLLLRSCVHGGLVPDGLLVATFGETMLLEAGLAGSALTIPSHRSSHPDVIAYRAPEQLEPGRTIDERADVFTVGILLVGDDRGPVAVRAVRASAPCAPCAAGEDRQGRRSAPGRRRRVARSCRPVPRLDSLPLLEGQGDEGARGFRRSVPRARSRRFASRRCATRSRAFTALDSTALSRHDAVVKLVSSLGISESHGAPPEEPGGSELESPDRASGRTRWGGIRARRHGTRITRKASSRRARTSSRCRLPSRPRTAFR